LRSEREEGREGGREREVLSAREGFGIGVQEVGLPIAPLPEPKTLNRDWVLGLGLRGRTQVKRKMKLQELWSPTQNWCDAFYFPEGRELVT
jgi:hypothetical protein